MTIPLFELPPIRVTDGRECKTCKQVKPFSEFQIERARTQGEEEFFHKHRCKNCCRELGRIQRSLGKEHTLRLYHEQDGRCAHCGRQEDPNGRPLGLDHCHYTLRVRGLLCMGCNTAIGNLGLDCPPEELEDRLARLANYLRG